MTRPPEEPPVARVDWDAVAAWRARRQGLDARVPADRMLDVAARLCGVHAQVMSSAELTLLARVDDLHPGAVADALWRDRTLVKTWAMRGTLHLLPTADLGLWLAGFGTYGHYLKPSWFKAAGVSQEELERLIAAIESALDDALLTREELAVAVAELTGDATLADRLRGSWGAMLKPAAFQGRLCFAPNAGRNVRFTLPRSWVGVEPDDDPEAAMLDVTRRHLAVHGPATREDLARWWGVQPAPGGRMLAALGDEVAAIDVEGVRHHVLAADVPDLTGAVPTGSVRLLPAFDQLVIAATKHADHLMPPGVRPRVYRNQGWISPVIAVDGRFAGIWKHERKGRRVEVDVQPFEALSRPVRDAVDAEADRVASYLEAQYQT